MHKLLSTLLLSLLLLSSAVAQPGGQVFAFLNIPASARVASLGGTFISIRDNDLNLAFQNPALLNSSMHNSFALSAVSLFDAQKCGDVIYARHYDKVGTFMAGMHYLNYGSFNETNFNGEVLNTFKVADYALTMAYAKPINKYFSLGASLKTIYSDYYIVSSLGIAADLGVSFYDSVSQVSIGLLGKNVGMQVKNYTPGNSEPLPIEVQIGISKKFSKAPFRMGLTFRHLQKFDITYVDPVTSSEIDPLTGDALVNKISFSDKVLRHIILNTEILMSKNFHLRAAYNFQRRNELAVDTRKSTAGLSFGFALKISKFHLGYGRSIYNIAGGTNHFSITCFLYEFYSAPKTL